MVNNNVYGFLKWAIYECNTEVLLTGNRGEHLWQLRLPFSQIKYPEKGMESPGKYNMCKMQLPDRGR